MCLFAFQKQREMLWGGLKLSIVSYSVVLYECLPVHHTAKHRRKQGDALRARAERESRDPATEAGGGGYVLRKALQ